MSREVYLSHLQQKGYTILNKNRVALGSLLFDVHEKVSHTAMGDQRTFCLKLSPKSDINLCPSPWQ